MNRDQETPSPRHTLFFDVVRTNLGNHYNKSSGIFTAPHSGTYVFTWTAYCFAGGHTYLQLVVNAKLMFILVRTVMSVGLFGIDLFRGLWWQK